MKNRIVVKTNMGSAIEDSFDDVQALKRIGLADEFTVINHNGIEYNAGAYNPDQKNLFMYVFKLLSNRADFSDEELYRFIMEFLAKDLSEELLYLISENIKRCIFRSDKNIALLERQFESAITRKIMASDSQYDEILINSIRFRKSERDEELENSQKSI